MNIEKLKKGYAEREAGIVLYFATLIFGIILANGLSVPPVIDEVATLANSAHILGRDWSEALFAMGGYYFKYGAALLYLPAMKLFKDVYTAYRMMLIANVVLYAFIPVFAMKILNRHMGVKKSVSVALAATTGLFPSTILYVLYARADAVLLFILWPIIYIILELIAIEGGAKGSTAAKKALTKRILLSCVLAVCMVYAYMAHTRGIAVVLAVVVSLILIRIVCKAVSVEWISFSVVSAVMLLIDKKAAGLFKSALYGKYGTSFSSAESFDFAYLKKIFTPGGFKLFLREITGTAYNVIVSSYGLAAIAFFAAITVFVLYLKNKNAASNAEMALITVSLMAFLASFMMSCIYFVPYAGKMLEGIYEERADWLVYGRYAACGAGPLVLYGLYYLCCRNLPEKKERRSRIVVVVLSSVLCLGTAAAFVFKCLDLLVGKSAVSRNFIQLCTFLKLPKDGQTTAVFDNLGTAFVYAGILAGVVMVLMLTATVGRNGRGFRVAAVVAVFAAASILIALVNYVKIRDGRDEVLYNGTKESVAVLTKVASKINDCGVVVDSGAKDIKHYQYLLPTYRCGRSNTDVFKEDEFFIIAKKGTLKKKYTAFEDLYVFSDFDYNNAEGDVVYIKGAKLANAAKKAGYKTAPYNKE